MKNKDIFVGIDPNKRVHELRYNTEVDIVSLLHDTYYLSQQPYIYEFFMPKDAILETITLRFIGGEIKTQNYADQTTILSHDYRIISLNKKVGTTIVTNIEVIRGGSFSIKKIGQRDVIQL